MLFHSPVAAIKKVFTRSEHDKECLIKDNEYNVSDTPYQKYYTLSIIH